MFGISRVVLAGLILAGAVAFAQSPSAQKDAPKPAPPKENAAGAAGPSLEELLSTAVKRSPDVEVAEAKLREADAELRRVRMQVMQKVIELHAGLEVQRMKLKAAEETFRHVSAMTQRGAVSSTELIAAELNLAMAKAVRAQQESMLKTLVGTSPQPNIDLTSVFPGMAGAGGGFGLAAGGADLAGGRFWADPEYNPALNPELIPRGPMVEKVYGALDKTVKFKGITETPLKDVLIFLKDLAPEVPFLIQVQSLEQNPVNLNLTGEIPLGGLLQALQDSVPDLIFEVRNYGILVSRGGQVGMPLEEFWPRRQKGGK